MGWTYEYHATHHDARGRVDRRACLDEKLTWESKDESGNVVKRVRPIRSAMVGATYYAACRSEFTDGRPAEVWAAVALTDARRNPRDGTEWGYKLMCEEEGPNADRCPASVLRLLTPTKDEWAREWRDRCRARLGSRAPASIDCAVVQFLPL